MAIVNKILVDPKAKCNCKKSQVFFEFDKSISKEDLQYFANNGFSQNTSYAKIGILYVEDATLVLIAPFGSNRLQIKCKKDCDVNIDRLENILKNF